MGVSRARELGARTIALPTAGNAGAAWAAYGARAGMPVVVAMPQDAPPLTQQEVRLYGAHLHLVDGLISDAGAWMAERVQSEGWYDASTFKEPYRVEGKKTLGLEIAEQLGWQPPDVILYPTGGGVGLIGLWKAFQRAYGSGLGRAGCAPAATRGGAGGRLCASGARVGGGRADDGVLGGGADGGGGVARAGSAGGWIDLAGAARDAWDGAGGER